MTKQFKAGHPPTPYPIPATPERVLKKRKIIEDEGTINTQPYLLSFPSLNSGYSPASLCCNVTSAELIKASESILNQVNWSEVVLDAVGKEKSAIYRNTFEKILRTQITELLKQEECIEMKHIKSGQKMGNADAIITGNGNDSNQKERPGREAEHFNDIFIGDYESLEGYEDEHEDDNDQENEEDEEYEPDEPDDDNDDDHEEDDNDYEDSDDGVSA